MTLPPNFWNKVRKTDYCWLWQAAQNTMGYGCFATGRTSDLSHRLAYKDAHGPIPEGMTIDHLCRTRNCVNPDHLQVVTYEENNRRKKVVGGLDIGDECVNGHVLTPELLYRHPRGHSECLECRRENKRRSIARARNQKQAAS